jgi:hypothetical protein
MTDDEFAAYQAREEVGHRPTWSLKSSRRRRAASRLAGAPTRSACSTLPAPTRAPRRRRQAGG